jgi:DNA polymerase-3 subunit epsilon
VKELLFLDTETGGLDSRENSLLSVGLVHWRDGEILDTLEVKVKHDIYKVTAKAMEVNKIDLATHDIQAVYPDVAWYIITKWLATRFTELPVTVVGHNVGFDMSFMMQLAPKSVLDTVLSYRTVDTSAILKYLYISGVLDQDIRGITAALEHFGISWEDQHNALSDATVTAQLFNRLVSLHP